MSFRCRLFASGVGMVRCIAAWPRMKCVIMRKQHHTAVRHFSGSKVFVLPSGRHHTLTLCFSVIVNYDGRNWLSPRRSEASKSQIAIILAMMASHTAREPSHARQSRSGSSRRYHHQCEARASDTSDGEDETAERLIMKRWRH